MEEPKPTPPADATGCLFGPLFAVAILILCGTALYVAGFVFNEPHGLGAHEDWRKSLGAVTLLAAGPMSFVVACVLAVAAVTVERRTLAWISLAFALAGFAIVAVLAAFGCGLVDGTFR